MRLTGTGMGGSGGRKAGKVEQLTLKGRGHFLVMEQGDVRDVVAERCAAWIGRWVKEQKEVDDWWRGYRSGRSEGGEMWRVSEVWKGLVGGRRADEKRPMSDEGVREEEEEEVREEDVRQSRRGMDEERRGRGNGGRSSEGWRAKAKL